MPDAIVIDALNYLGQIFCPVSLAKKMDPWKRIDIMEHNVKRTIDAFKRANYDPIFVIDAGFSSTEVLCTWLARREREVRRAVRNVPYNADTVLAALLMRHGAKVVRSSCIDADDVCILLAKQLQCSIVSGDTDMLRYSDWPPNNRLFSHWKFNNRRGIVLIPQLRTETTVAKRNNGERIAGETWIDIKYELGMAGSSKVVFRDPNICIFVYRRGNADENTRAIGNLHALSRPLRCALYAHLKLMKVREVYPSWQCETVVWTDEIVNASEADNDLIDILTYPLRVLEWFKENDVRVNSLEKRNQASRKFAWMLMTAEIVAAASDVPCILSELRIAESLRLHCTNSA